MRAPNNRIAPDCSGSLEMALKNCRILVTGASGFLGGRVASRLVSCVDQLFLLGRRESDFGRLGFDQKSVTILRSNDAEEVVNLVREAAPDIVFNCAGRVLTDHQISDVHDLVVSNIVLHASILEGLQRGPLQTMRMVSAGTYLEHGPEGQLEPNSLYSATKLACRPISEFYSQRKRLRFMVVKLPVMYGPTEHRPRLVNLLLNAARSGLVLDMSPGFQKLNLLYVEDAVDALVAAGNRCLDSDDSLIMEYFALSENTIDLHELVEIVEKITGNSLNINWGAVPYKQTEVMTPFVAGPLVPNWRPRTTICDGLSATLSGMLATETTAQQ